MDNIVGTSGNDTINATLETGKTIIGGLDSIDGGAGNDSLNIADSISTAGSDFLNVAGFTVKDVENLKVVTNGSIGKGGATTFDLSGMTGLTSANLTAAGIGSGTGSQVKAANTTDVTLTVGDGIASVTGGKAVNVTTAGGAATVKGDALTTVTVKGAATASTVENTVNGAGVTGTTLTAVTFEDMATGTVTAKGDALTSLTLKNQDVTLTANVTNAVSKSLTVNLENAGYDATAKALIAGAITVATGAAAETVTVNSTGTNKLALTAGVATAIKATGAGDVTLALTAASATSFDGSAATGDIALSGFATGMTSIKTGAGDDSFTTNQTAKSTFDTGAGNDTVTVGSNLAAGTSISLGAGNDKLLYSAGSIANSTATATTLVDGGDGSDTLALELVGAANIGVFKNFEVFDVVGMTAKTLDLDILATNNTVTGITGSGATAGAVTLTNLGAGVGFTALADMDKAAGNVVTLTQKTAGALTVTLDDDSTSTVAQNDSEVSLVATNATSLKAVFASDSGYVQNGANLNVQEMVLTGTKATSLEIVSGGTEASNVLNYTGGVSATAGTDLLTSVTVSGSQDLSFSYTGSGAATSAIATFDASALTGDLTFDLGALKNGGMVKLGSGTDLVTVGTASIIDDATGTKVESISGLEKSTSKTDADAIKAADKLVGTFTVAANGDHSAGANTYVVKDGILTFVGTGPTTLQAAASIADAAVSATVGESVAFEYLGNTYVFTEQGATDTLVKLVGITGSTVLAADANADLYLV